jgi:ubiquinone/menaquinone biosynthesis C-methylase UbiE
MKNNKSSLYYDYHWNDYQTLDIPGVKTANADAFLNQISNNFSSNETVLDVGCGNGVHWNYLRNIKNYQVDYFGIDNSRSAIENLKALSKHENDTFDIQDACNIQYPDNFFDVVFAYGVLGYTRDPELAFNEMFRVCKKRGVIGVFSPDIQGLSRFVLDSIRFMARLVGMHGKKFLADLVVPVFGFASSDTNISLKNANWHQVREVILTNIGPKTLEIIKHKTIIRWFKDLNIEVLYNNQKAPTQIWGRK